MNLWGVTPLLAAALLGGSSGTHVAAVGHAVPRAAAQSRSIERPAAPTPSPSPQSNLALVPTSPVLSQVGPVLWQTTLLLTDTSPGCQGDASYQLQTLSPDSTINPTQVSRPVAALAYQATGSSCEVTLSFNGLRQVPGKAVLVITQAGIPSAVLLPVIRDVTLFYYLGIPVIAGCIMVLCLLIASMLTIRINGQRPRPGSKKFWTVSGTSSLNNNWAANIGVVLTLVATFFAITTAVSSLFPGVTLDRFAIVIVVAGVIVVAAPLVFRMLYLRWTRRNPGVNSDAILTLSGRDYATINVATGASVIMSGDAAVSVGPTCVEQHSDAAGGDAPGDAPGGDGPGEERSAAKPQATTVRAAGYTIQVPPGSDIRVLPGAVMAMPGTADIGVQPGSELEIYAKNATFTISADDMVSASVPQPASASITFPLRITANGGAKITVDGFADVSLPRDTAISGRSSSQPIKLFKEWDVRLPANNNVIAASLDLVMIQAAVTMFGTGALIGIACVLTYGLSEASQPGRLAMLAFFLAVGIFVLYSVVNAIRVQFASPA